LTATALLKFQISFYLLFTTKRKTRNSLVHQLFKFNKTELFRSTTAVCVAQILSILMASVSYINVEDSSSSFKINMTLGHDAKQIKFI